MNEKGDIKKVITAVCVGNFLEIFDFTIFGFFAAYIGLSLYGNYDAHWSLFVSEAVFAVGFFSRPLGAVILGAYSDRYGSKAGLTACIAFMGLGCLIILLAPSYATAGILGGIMLVIGRLLQGFSTGGEIGSGLTMLFDNADPKIKDFIASWQMAVQGISTACGSALAFGLNLYLTHDQLVNWGWKIPFVITLLIVPVGIYIRKHAKDRYVPTGEATKIRDSKLFALKELLFNYTGVLVCILFIGGALSATLYFLWYFLPNYFMLVASSDPTISVNLDHVRLLAVVGGLGCAVIPLIAGFLIDKIGAGKNKMRIRRNWLFWGFVGLVILIIIDILCIRHFGLFVFFCILTNLFLSSNCAVSINFLGEAFPRHIRATGIAVSYALYAAIFGGTAQAIITLLLNTTNNLSYAPLFYLTPLGIAACISSWAIKYYMDLED